MGFQFIANYTQGDTDGDAEPQHWGVALGYTWDALTVAANYGHFSDYVIFDSGENEGSFGATGDSEGYGLIAKGWKPSFVGSKLRTVSIGAVWPVDTRWAAPATYTSPITIVIGAGPNTLMAANRGSSFIGSDVWIVGPFSRSNPRLSFVTSVTKPMPPKS
jgi:hypothetical protein